MFKHNYSIDRCNPSLGYSNHAYASLGLKLSVCGVRVVVLTHRDSRASCPAASVHCKLQQLAALAHMPPMHSCCTSPKHHPSPTPPFRSESRKNDAPKDRPPVRISTHNKLHTISISIHPLPRRPPPPPPKAPQEQTPLCCPLHHRRAARRCRLRERRHLARCLQLPQEGGCRRPQAGRYRSQW